MKQPQRRFGLQSTGLLLALLLCACTPKPVVSESSQNGAVSVLLSEDHAKASNDFRSYWYAGLAELNRYKIQQARYGELHEGESVEIYVTEDFLPQKGVKYEFGDKSGAVPILKVHKHRRFYTGLYPYNVHSTAFVPTQKGASPLKLSFSTTDWCGIAYGQLNKGSEGYRVQSHSYFQAEGDQDFNLENAVLEDGIWAMIRRDPQDLPLGELQVVPSAQHMRLKHKPIQALRATATVNNGVSFDGWEGQVSVYELDYPDHDRSLKIYFEAEFPYRIVGFEEASAAMFNPNGGEPEAMTTRGVLTNSIMLDYWSKHRLDDAPYRETLGLQF